MHDSAMKFACEALTAPDVTGKQVIEAGGQDVNGSVRGHVESLGPDSYIVTDLELGRGVDHVCDAANLFDTFGERDTVISTEMLEHCADWMGAMRGLVATVTRGGLLVLTTRGPGFPYHGYPDDYWRFTPAAMLSILELAGLTVELCIADPTDPGVFAAARKPESWQWPYNLAAAWRRVPVTTP